MQQKWMAKMDILDSPTNWPNARPRGLGRARIAFRAKLPNEDRESFGQSSSNLCKYSFHNLLSVD